MNLNWSDLTVVEAGTNLPNAIAVNAAAPSNEAPEVVETTDEGDLHRRLCRRDGLKLGEVAQC